MHIVIPLHLISEIISTIFLLPSDWRATFAHILISAPSLRSLRALPHLKFSIHFNIPGLLVIYYHFPCFYLWGNPKSLYEPYVFVLYLLLTSHCYTPKELLGLRAFRDSKLLQITVRELQKKATKQSERARFHSITSVKRLIFKGLQGILFEALHQPSVDLQKTSLQICAEEALWRNISKLLAKRHCTFFEPKTHYSQKMELFMNRRWTAW